MQVTIRPAEARDLSALVRIYNHYIESSPATFDLAPHTIDERRDWFGAYSDRGRHRMLVAETAPDSDAGGAPRVVGYAGSGQFRKKAAYDPSVEASIYLDPDATGHGVGAVLYEELLGLMRGEPGVHRVYAGITLPNDASVALHERFGFERVGTFREVGLKFDRYWDVAWYELDVEGGTA